MLPSTPSVSSVIIELHNIYVEQYFSANPGHDSRFPVADEVSRRNLEREHAGETNDLETYSRSKSASIAELLAVAQEQEDFEFEFPIPTRQ